MATLLVIGGTGFFGKSILDSYKRQLLNSWNIDKIIIMSRNANEFKQNFPELISNGVELLVGDISTIDFLPEADFVIHAAASTDATRYLNHSEEEKNNIIAGTLNYCKLALIFHKKSKIVFCSSGAVYGYQPENLKCLKEDDDFGDISNLDDIKKSYAYAKRDSELAIQELAKKNLNVVIARCFSFVGRYLPRDQHFAIGNFISDGLKGKDIFVKSEKSVYRSYMYADDLVIWLITLAENANSNCSVYNVGSDKEIEIRKLANIIAGIFDVNVNSEEIDHNSVDRYIPSIKKAQIEFNLSNILSLKESIILTTRFL
ncbi:NAD(P)-dependent oxidoreductase [Candidatus Thioglobus sp.]|nr:NAD(P)-dependent oxidoreductase [Candidatus Thioglobus sp.]